MHSNMKTMAKGGGFAKFRLPVLNSAAYLERLPSLKSPFSGTYPIIYTFFLFNALLLDPRLAGRKKTD